MASSLKASEGYGLIYGFQNIDMTFLTPYYGEKRAKEVRASYLKAFNTSLHDVKDCGFVLAILDPNQTPWEPHLLAAGFVKQKQGYNWVHAHMLSLYILHRPRSVS